MFAPCKLILQRVPNGSFREGGIFNIPQCNLQVRTPLPRCKTAHAFALPPVVLSEGPDCICANVPGQCPYPLPMSKNRHLQNRHLAPPEFLPCKVKGKKMTLKDSLGGPQNGLKNCRANRFRLFWALPCQNSGTDMTGRPGYWTMEMIGGSSASYLARTPCVPLFCTSFNRVGNKERFRLPGAGGGSFPLCGGTFARSYSVSKNGCQPFCRPLLFWACFPFCGRSAKSQFWRLQRFWRSVR